MNPFSPDVLAKLRKFDTPTICNVVELFDVRPRNTGYMDERIKTCFPEMPAIVGFAATATFRGSAPARQNDAYADLGKQIERFSELSGPAIVVFQDLDNPSAAATFGEIMCTAYQTFGAVGLITSGTGRDLDQVRRIGFPVFTNGAVCAHGYVHIPQIHIPVHVGGIIVYPNDMLHADCNGVTTIPLEIAAEVADAGDEFVAAEAVVLDCLHTNPTLAQFQEARAESRRKIEALHARLSRARKDQ
ncbi:MAG TPA: RraA family protein [Anaerolineaceae bacterium]